MPLSHFPFHLFVLNGVLYVWKLSDSRINTDVSKLLPIASSRSRHTRSPREFRMHLSRGLSSWPFLLAYPPGLSSWPFLLAFPYYHPALTNISSYIQYGLLSRDVHHVVSTFNPRQRRYLLRLEQYGRGHPESCGIVGYSRRSKGGQGHCIRRIHRHFSRKRCLRS
jgi:hypothetical protein